MALSLIGGAALGAPFGELLKVVITVIRTTSNFKSLLERLKSTLTSLYPIILQVSELNQLLDHHSYDETNSFIDLLEKGKGLVFKCCLIQWWNVYEKCSHSKKLRELESSIVNYFQVHVQAQLAIISRRTLIIVQNLSIQNDRILSAVTSYNGFRFSGTCSVPQLPDFLVGLEFQVEELKRILFRNDVSVLVLSAPRGIGKTSLAKMLCHDKNIREIYKDNIFYVTVSKKTNLRNIVKQLFDHICPVRMNEFETDEEAKSQLENLMKQLRAQNILLVLDDVWLGSAHLVQMLEFNIPGFKILVTSRFVFPRFSSTYTLKALKDEDAKTLFCYSAFPKDRVPNVPDNLLNENFVSGDYLQTVKYRKWLPLAPNFIGASLCGQPTLKWKGTLKKCTEVEIILDQMCWMRYLPSVTLIWDHFLNIIELQPLHLGDI